MDRGFGAREDLWHSPRTTRLDRPGCGQFAPQTVLPGRMTAILLRFPWTLDLAQDGCVSDQSHEILPESDSLIR